MAFMSPYFPNSLPVCRQLPTFQHILQRVEPHDSNVARLENLGIPGHVVSNNKGHEITGRELIVQEPKD